MSTVPSRNCDKSDTEMIATDLDLRYVSFEANVSKNGGLSYHFRMLKTIHLISLLYLSLQQITLYHCLAGECGVVEVVEVVVMA